MKCIDEEIPFEIPESWEWCRLGSVAFYKKGPFGSSITKSMFIPESENAIKVYEQKNAIYKNAEIGSYYISEEKFDELKGFQVYPNDIIVSCAGTIGETYVMPKEIKKGIINQALMRIKLFNNEILDFYLMYFDFVLKNQANEQGKGTAIKNIPPFDILKNFLLPLPPLNEQYRIRDFIQEINGKVDCVDNDKNIVSALITQTKSKILDLAIRGKLVPQDPNDEPASVLLERIKAEHPENKKKAKYTGDNSHYPFMIPKSWEWVQVIDIAKLITGNTPSKENKNLYGFDFPFYKPADLEKGINVSTALDNLSSLGYEISRKLPKNSILVTCIGATIGKVGLIKQEGTCNQQINAIVPYFGIEPIFIYYFCISTFFQTQIKGNASATTLPIINKNKFGMLQITIPPTQEQIRIIKKIEEIFDSLDRIENSIKA